MNIRRISDNNAKNQPKPNNFDEFLPWACLQYNIEAEICIIKGAQKVLGNASPTTKKQALTKKTSKQLSSEVQDSGSCEDNNGSEFERPTGGKKNIVNIETVYDTYKNLVQLKFFRNKNIPRIVMQIIELTIPYHKHLTSITVNSGLSADCLYQMSKFLPDSHITELCFDGTFLRKANYHILLTHGKLKHISLARCSLNDDYVKMIADQIRHPKPAARVLSALNLSANNITDIGAKYLAEMLRSNRQLSYLNLAGNTITDDGGVSILNTLQKFPLQPQELLEGRCRYVDHLKKKNSIIHAFVKDIQTTTIDKSAAKKKFTKKGKVEYLPSQQDDVGAAFQRSIQDRAEHLAGKKLGLFIEPFSLNNTETQNGVEYCFGNNTLCYLNIAYNNLTYISLQKLREVLLSQQFLNRTPKGLIKVVIEGNLMPEAREEFEEIESLLGSGINDYIKNLETVTTKKSLTSRSTVK